MVHCLLRPEIQSVATMAGLEDAIVTGGTAGDDIGIEHHERESSVTFERMGTGKDADSFFFIVGEPVVAWDPGIVFVNAAVSVPPVVKLAASDAEPDDEAGLGDLGLVSPGADEVDDGIAGVVGNPGAG